LALAIGTRTNVFGQAVNTSPQLKPEFVAKMVVALSVLTFCLSIEIILRVLKVKREAEKTRDPELKKKTDKLLRKICVLCKKLGY
jgi:hypothetical protein